MTKEIVWTPPEEIIKNSKLTSFIKYCNLKNYDTLESKALQNPGWLWDNVIKFSDLKFYKNYEQIMDESDGIPWTKWCVGGKTNIVLNCIDRHKDKELFNDTFIFSEKENGETSSITYQDFDKKISQVGNALKSNGFVKGDVIALYMPQIIETYIAYFAILKVGCVVLPLFSGYGSNAVVDRLKIAKAKGIFTSSITFRKGKEIKMFDTIKDGVEALDHLTKNIFSG